MPLAPDTTAMHDPPHFATLTDVIKLM